MPLSYHKVFIFFQSTRWDAWFWRSSGCALRSFRQLLVAGCLLFPTWGFAATASEIFARAFIVDGNLNASIWSEDEACSSGSQLGCWPRNAQRDYSFIRDEMGINLFSTNGFPRTNSANSSRLVLTSNAIETARRDNHVGAIRYIQKIDLTALATQDLTDSSDENLERIAEALADDWVAKDIRILQPAYSRRENADLITDTGFDARLAGGANEDQGLDIPLSSGGACVASAGSSCHALSALGEKVIRNLLDRHVIIDVSHVGRNSALEIVRIAKSYNRPILANHPNAAAIYTDSVSRNHQDDVICAVAQTGGVVGVTPVRFMLSGSALNGEDVTEAENYQRLIAHLDHMRSINCSDDDGNPINMINHLGIASDGYLNGLPLRSNWLGVRGFNAFDRWMTVADRMLDSGNYTVSDIRKLFGLNLLRVYNEALPGLRAPLISETGRYLKPRLQRPPRLLPDPTRLEGPVPAAPGRGDTGPLNPDRFRPDHGIGKPSGNLLGQYRLSWGKAKAQSVAEANSYTLHLYRVSKFGVSGKPRKQFIKQIPGGNALSLDINAATLPPRSQLTWFVRASNGAQQVDSDWASFQTRAFPISGLTPR